MLEGNFTMGKVRVGPKKITNFSFTIVFLVLPTVVNQVDLIGLRSCYEIVDQGCEADYISGRNFTALLLFLLVCK